jgi:hypoxanthine phosphoribosyltransferase
MVKSNMAEVLYMSWEDFEGAMRDAVAGLSKHPLLPDQPTGVYGIPRGGLIPAVTLSHRLSTPLLLKPQPGCILVDDVIDTGHTMQTLIKNLHKQHPGLHWVAWVWITKTVVPGIEYQQYVDPKIWVCFPWSDPLRMEQEKRAYHARLAREVRASVEQEVDH